MNPTNAVPRFFERLEQISLFPGMGAEGLLLQALILAAILVGLPAAIVILKGGPAKLALQLVGVALLGMVMMLSLFTAPAGLFVIGRCFYIAITARSSDNAEHVEPGQ